MSTDPNTIDFSDRHLYIGGSEIAAVVGLNPYKTPLQVYQEKRGEAEPEDLSDNEAVHFGNVLEDVIAEEFSRRNAVQVRRDNTVYTLDDSPIRGHIDRRLVGVKEGLECKHASFFFASEFGEEGTDQLPMHYLIQCHGYLALTGWETWHLGVLCGGNNFRQYTVTRDDDLCQSLVDQVNHFWANLQQGIPPEPMNLEDLIRLYPTDDGGSIGATIDIAQACTDLNTIKADLKQIDARKKELEMKIKKHMGSHALLIGPDEGLKPIATWKHNDVNRIDTTALKKEMPDIAERYTVTSTQRRFLIK